MTVGRFKEILIAVVGDVHVDMPKGKSGAVDILDLRLDPPKCAGAGIINIVT